jgi:hypothetical protein
MMSIEAMEVFDYKWEYITKFTPESGLPGWSFMFLKAVASGLKCVLINFVMYSHLSVYQ